MASVCSIGRQLYKGCLHNRLFGTSVSQHALHKPLPTCYTNTLRNIKLILLLTICEKLHSLAYCLFFRLGYVSSVHPHPLNYNISVHNFSKYISCRSLSHPVYLPYNTELLRVRYLSIYQALACPIFLLSNVKLARFLSDFGVVRGRVIGLIQINCHLIVYLRT